MDNDDDNRSEARVGRADSDADVTSADTAEAVGVVEHDLADTADEAGPAAAADDVLPDDLQPHLVDPEDYIFPNNNRRRVPGYLYLVIAAGLCALVVVASEHPFVNGGLIGAAAVLAVVGVYSIVSGWNLDVDERDALVAAVNEVGFPVGHASAQMGWRGLLSRPTWRILLYSADEPPAKRGFILVDGVDATIIEAIVEDNPEDWSQHNAADELS